MDHPKELAVGVLPFLFTQARLDDAAALLGHAPSGFVRDNGCPIQVAL